MQPRNKREILQAIIDDSEGSWIIMKPSRHNPTDQDSLCEFENPATHTEAKVDIPAAWFDNQEIDKIKAAVCQSLEQAEAKYKL